MNQQLISVIVAAYNVEKYLDRCIKSIVTQTYPYLEIFLIDDGSTDRTGSICDEWAQKDNRIIVIHKNNGGVSDVRNTGVRLAHGKWLGFVDGDDYISPTMFERLYQHRTENGITVCGFLIENNGRLLACPGIDKTLQPLEAVDLYLSNEFQSISQSKFTYWGSYPWNKLYDHCLFNNITYLKGKKYEDVCVLFDLVQQAKSIRFIPDCEYTYVQNSDSITHDVSIIEHDMLAARLIQKEQLFKYWKISSVKIDKLVALEYFTILHRYAIVSPRLKADYQETATKAWKMLKDLGYDYFPVKLKIRLFMCLYCPRLYYFVWKAKQIIKR